MIVVPRDYGFWGLLLRSEGHPWPVPRSSLALVTPQQPPKPYSGKFAGVP